MRKPNFRRTQTRVPYEENVLINDSLRVRAIDISEGGLYLHTGRACPTGTTVRVQFPILYELIMARAEVRFCHEGVGMGLEFKDLTKGQKDLIRRYIQQALDKGEGVTEAKRVALLVGAEDMGMKMYRSQLTLSQFTALQATTPQEVITRAREQKIGIVIMALDMEREENVKLLANMKTSSLLEHTPTIVVSPTARPDTQKRVYDVGADLFLHKITASPKKVVEEAIKLFEQSVK